MRSQFARALAAAVIALPTITVMTAAAAPPAVAAVPAAETGAFFNNPEGDRARQYAIVNHITRNIKASARYAESHRAHPTIRVAIYSLTIPAFADALLDAHKRGVNVQVIMDHHAINDLWRRLAAGLNRPRWEGDTSFARTCGSGGACLTGYPGSSVHAKFFSFSLGGQWAVTVSSANPTVAQAEVAWNHAYTVAGNATLYAAFVKYFNAMKNGERQRQPNYYRFTDTEPRTYFFPKKKGGTDTIESILGNISSCKGTTVRVAMFEWTIGRKNLATKLVALGRAGCKIKILLTDGAVDGGIKTTLAEKRNVTVIDTSKGEGCSGPYACHYTHSKYFLITGHYLGAQRELVFAGSPNWTINGLHHNDEALQKIASREAYNAFLANFKAQEEAVTSPGRVAERAESAEKELRVRPNELQDS